MPKLTIPELIVRTTVDSPGYAYGVTIGTGGSVDAAMTGLYTEARRRRRKSPWSCRARHQDPEDTDWRFEVIGYALIPGHR